MCPNCSDCGGRNAVRPRHFCFAVDQSDTQHVTAPAPQLGAEQVAEDAQQLVPGLDADRHDLAVNRARAAVAQPDMRSP
jgi:hypothetical protein